MISFTIHGDPKGQPRHKVTTRGKFAHAYLPKGPHVLWTELVLMEAQKHRPEKPIDGPVCLQLYCRMPRPKSHYNKNGLRKDAPVYHTKKPDSDNIEKLIMDRLTACGFWIDDAQVCSKQTMKTYHDDGESPGCAVTVSELENATVG